MFDLTLPQKTTAEHIKCTSRRYTVLSIILFAVLLNVGFWIGVSRYQAGTVSLETSQLLVNLQRILLVDTVIILLVVIGGYLLAQESIKQQMTKTIDKLLDAIHGLSPESPGEQLEVQGLHCDDELLEVVEVLNSKSQQIQAYIDHLKKVIGFIHHEFNTPLSSALLRLERLQRRVDRVDHQDDIDKVQSNLLHLSQLVVSLSQLIGLDRDQIVYEQQDLVPIIEQSVADCQLIYPDKQILTDLPEQYELATHAEYAQIVVRNILENACKYSPVRGEVNLQLVDDQLHISDQGCGISDHDKERVWLPFWQADSSREVDHGFGLGLALVRELSRKLGWEITFTNLEPHGTCFTIGLSGDVDTLSDRG